MPIGLSEQSLCTFYKSNFQNRFGTDILYFMSRKCYLPYLLVLYLLHGNKIKEHIFITDTILLTKIDFYTP